MIVFDLICHNGHIFEGWFSDSESFAAQSQEGLVECPVCGSHLVDKKPSTFAIHSSSPSRPSSPPVAKTGENGETGQKPAMDPEEVGRRVVEFVKENFDDVGADFTSEALKMHYGVSQPRNIRGSSTTEEEKLLEKEGIKYFKFPLPDTSESDA